MPYLKIKVANNTDNDWTIINDLNLNKLTIDEEGTLDNKGTISGGSIINTKVVDKKVVQSVEISNGELKIQSPGDTTGQSLSEYLNLNTSGCTVGNSSEPESYTNWGKKTPKKGDLYIQLKTVGEGSEAVTYSLLWYRDDTGWKHVHAIWG